ncbi:hypothetical protein JCGZ_21285 [Jatropha curcas]|uniref:Protein kinase domain-containing protein n=1 Tax=Jatropha curcas TaxID=180498 RepID=A0A067JMT1_JATCU|nr:hypothetical protein JCGZ_21285 [Jatropha curcas]
MQCTPDLSSSDCSYCLQQAAGDYNNCSRGKRGFYVTKPSCTFRWDLYPFYTSIAEPPTPPPPPLLNISPSAVNYTRRQAARAVVIGVAPTIILVSVMALTCALFRYRKSKQPTKSKLHAEDLNENSSTGCQQFTHETIRLATDNFSDNNKLGQGGFGSDLTTYGQRVAVKKLLRNSRQGEVQFKNEVTIVARIQRTNLVRLLGFCFEGNEKLLLYEFVPNSSVDRFIFDPVLLEDSSRSEILRCIHIALLCLQEDAAKRPTRASVVLMLTSHSLVLTKPSKPAYLMRSSMERKTSLSPESTPARLSQGRPIQCSINDASITELEPR